MRDFDLELLFRLTGKPNETLDEEDDDKELFYDEYIFNEAKLIAKHSWDSGGPGAGAGGLSIYDFRGLYISSDDEGHFGPFESLKDAFDSIGFFNITDASESIWVRVDYQKRRRSDV